jgi:hypothetical protein
VRKVDATGTVTTVAGTGKTGFSPDGTPAMQAALDSPHGLALGPGGEIYICDSGNNRVRRIAADGTLQTIAGGDTPGDFGDGGPATLAGLNGPQGICLYDDDVLLISDHVNNRVKAVKLAGP